MVKFGAHNFSPRVLFLGIAGVFAFAALIMLLRRFDPAEYSFYPKCTLFQLTGMHCPGCGATRAVGALAGGRLLDAVRYNPLLIVGGPIIALVVFRKVKQGQEAKWKVFTICFVIVLIVFGIARNVPSPTRSILAPPGKTTKDAKKPMAAARKGEAIVNQSQS